MTAAAPHKRRYRMVVRADAATATRERILLAAWRQFSERGFDGVRIADVGSEAGVSAQTVHAHFRTKDDLFVAAWSAHMAPEGALRNRAQGGDVHSAVRLLYDSYERDGDAVLRLLAQEERIPAVKEMADAGRRWHRDWVGRTFAPLLEGLVGAQRERRHDALVVATDLLVWKLLRREMRLSRRAAERVVTEMVTCERGTP